MSKNGIHFWKKIWICPGKTRLVVILLQWNRMNKSWKLPILEISPSWLNYPISKAVLTPFEDKDVNRHPIKTQIQWLRCLRHTEECRILFFLCLGVKPWSNQRLYIFYHQASLTYVRNTLVTVAIPPLIAWRHFGLILCFG